uniref:Uncharacterized protein n=1 Tax=Romanomermis culicivorax TaxID=13658 RepID=A0A915IS08_ROMCU
MKHRKLLTVHGNSTLLQCESRTNPNDVMLLMKNGAERRFYGLQSVYYGCNNCAKSKMTFLSEHQSKCAKFFDASRRNNAHSLLGALFPESRGLSWYFITPLTLTGSMYGNAHSSSTIFFTEQAANIVLPPIDCLKRLECSTFNSCCDNR